MLIKVCHPNTNRHFICSFSRIGKYVGLCLLVLFVSTSIRAQVYQSSYNSRRVFSQEIARLEITVQRENKLPLPISLVPRIRKNDLLRVRMRDEPINGIRPDRSFWNWSLVVAFVNPSLKDVEQKAVSREIYFKRDGWFKEHVFIVPYDSQPVFFLYPQPKYRKKIRKLIGKNIQEIKKIGEKTLEIADAYNHISIFISELQKVINYDQYGSTRTYSNPLGATNIYGEGVVLDQVVERLALGFNISLPECWSSGRSQFAKSGNFMNRAQCVAKKVRLEDFDISISRIIRQGGLFGATKLVEKFPQLTYWINLAVTAIDLISKIRRKSPLRIVPTFVQYRNSSQNYYNSYGNYRKQNQSRIPRQQTISLYSETSPTDSRFVTAFPIVLHKWQAEPDPEVISLPIPSFVEPCVHIGQNTLTNTDISYDWLRDRFTREFKLVMSAENGFFREFPLTKNLGISGWTFNVNTKDIQAFPKIKMKVESKIVATRGFTQIESEPFILPIAGKDKWKISKESFSGFLVGGQRRVAISNAIGNSNCLQSIKYKHSSGRELTFRTKSRNNPIRLSEDGSKVWVDIDTNQLSAGKGTLEIHTHGSKQPFKIPLALFPPVPEITKIHAYRGDNKVLIEGRRLDQIKTLRVNGKLAGIANRRLNSRNQSSSSQKVFEFQKKGDQILLGKVSIEMGLLEGRVFAPSKVFPVLPARPAIQTKRLREIEPIMMKNKRYPSRFDLSEYPIASINVEAVTISAKVSLTDYSLRAENISIETRIENGEIKPKAQPEMTFEVLDPFTLEIRFIFNQRLRQILAGRRLQFRLRDQIRGTSDWYTINKTFVRFPEIKSVRCYKNECKITGSGLSYIGEVSTNAGRIWDDPPQVQGNMFLIIKGIRDKKLLRFKLRDFPDTKALQIK